MILRALVCAACLLFATQSAMAQLENELRSQDIDVLVARTKLAGNPQRGALVFYKSAAACSKCHSDGDKPSPLGPALSDLGKEMTDEYIIESLLYPSKKIRKGFETLSVFKTDGKVVTGMADGKANGGIKLRDPNDLDKPIIIPEDDIDEIETSKKSMMPDGLINALNTEQEFFDLVRYIGELARGGKSRADELRPSPSELVVIDDTKDIDHAGILRSLGKRDLEVGRLIYNGHCTNCHGWDGNTPTLPTARAFGTQELKYGSDPHKMFMTVSRGAGLMAALSHLTPKERYQVVYYIREQFMKPSNEAYVAVDDAYLKSLPKGTNKGEGDKVTDRDYGPVLAAQLGREVNGGLTFRLDDEITACYDLHRMRLGGIWQGGFLDLTTTHHYRQRGEGLPSPDGAALPGLKAWQWAFDESFEISADNKPPRGPVRGDWLEYHGHYLHNDQAILSYAIEGRDVLETITAKDSGDFVAVAHTLRIEPSDKPLLLSVGQLAPNGGLAGVVAPGASEVAGNKGPASHMAVVAGGKQVASNSRRGSRNAPLHIVKGNQAKQLDLGSPERKVVVRFRTERGGTLVASAPEKGKWATNGKTLFVRGGRVVFDIGWVGEMSGRSRVNDGQWHTAALVVEEDETHLYVDGRLEASREDFRRSPEKGHALKIGSTTDDFGGDFVGEIASVQIVDDILEDDELEDIDSDDSLFTWSPNAKSTTPTTVASTATDTRTFVAAAACGDTDGMEWTVESDGRILLSIPAGNAPRVVQITRCSTEGWNHVESFRQYTTSLTKKPVVDPQTLTKGGKPRWPQVLEVEGRLGEAVNGYALDTIPVPFENPWNAWVRTSAVDFFEDGTAVVTTHGGDVYLVRGIDNKLEKVTWKRIAAGLFEPFGVKVVDSKIYVTARDGLKRLHDHNGDEEVDFVEAFWVDDDLSSTFHAFNFDLQIDAEGNFYFTKSGQYTQHSRPGTVMKIPPEGGTAEVFAWGLRTPNGMGRLPGDRFLFSDNQGPWMPAGKISLIKQGKFYGCMPINGDQDKFLRERYDGELPDTFEQPIVWTPQQLDNSCGGQLWVDDPRFGPLSGRLLHSSFGKGWLYYMSLQEIDDQMQASIVALPHQWDAGVMRMHVNPVDGQVYGVGLSGWQGPRGGKDGCLQRLRYAGKPVLFIEDAQVTSSGLELKFSFDIDAESTSDKNAWKAEMWNYLWSKKYGSDQFSVKKPGQKGHDKLNIEKVVVDGNTVQLEIPDLEACDQLQLDIRLKNKSGETFVERLFMTIHNIPKE